MTLDPELYDFWMTAAIPCIVISIGNDIQDVLLV